MRAARGLLVSMTLLCGQAAAQGLYDSSVIVTGMDLRSRPAGLARALAQVLAKASGNPAWLDDPRAAAADPASLLQGFAYVDRDSNIPKHDEQGTRDRPYDLLAAFRPAAIDARLHEWGDVTWPLPRPVVAIDIAVTPRRGDPIHLQADTDADERHRAALLAAASRFGIVLWLPAENGGVRAPPGSPVLQGTLVWSDAAFGWVGHWTLLREGFSPTADWGLRGVGFDAAYRDAVAGAVRVLSGH